MPKNPGSIKLFCIECGEAFFRFPSDIAKGRDKYCSVDCASNGKTGRTTGKSVRVEVVCPTCGKTFFPYPSDIKRGAGKYCSKHCKEKWRTDEERFWAFYVKPEKEGECPDWSGGKDKDGYALFSVGRKTMRASHYAYELHYGPIPQGMFVLHKCDSPACTDWKCLFLGTHAENMRDKMMKNRSHSALTNEDVLEIRKIGKTMKSRDLAARFNVNIWTIQAVLARRTFTHLP